MKRKKRLMRLIHDEQFQNCINSGSTVQAHINGELVMEGIISSFSEYAILFGNEVYFREHFSFFTLQNYFKINNDSPLIRFNEEYVFE